MSFRHLYFSPDRRGARAREDAAKALAKLAGQPEDAKLAASLADPFMFQDYYRDRAPEFLGKEFGPTVRAGGCEACRRDHGRGRSSPVSAGIWCSSIP